MKKAIIISSLFLAFTMSAQEHSPLMTIQAEDKLPTREDNAGNGFRIGGRFGIGESKIRGSGLSNMTGRLAVSGGIATNYQFNRFVSLNADILLSSLGGKTSGVSEERDFFGNSTYYGYQERFDFLMAQVPLTGQLTARTGNFFIKGYLGPSINFKLLAIETRDYNDPGYDEENGYSSRNIVGANNVNYAMVYGFGIGAYDRDNKIYFLDVRLNTGLSPVSKIHNYDGYINYYTISAGYYF